MDIEGDCGHHLLGSCEDQQINKVYEPYVKEGKIERRSSKWGKGSSDQSRKIGSVLTKVL